MSRLLGLLARAWRALTAPVELDDTDRAWRYLGDDQPPVWRVGKKRAGRLLDGRTHDGYPGGEA